MATCTALMTKKDVFYLNRCLENGPNYPIMKLIMNNMSKLLFRDVNRLCLCRCELADFEEWHDECAECEKSPIKQ